MDDDYLMDVNSMGLDLNQEPMDPPQPSVAGVGSLLNELETPHGRIEERIRQLEGVSARAMQRQRWLQGRSSVGISRFSSEMMAHVDGERGIGLNNIAMVERIVGNGKARKRRSSYLIAKALDMEPEVQIDDDDEGSFYDCNICLDLATDPILTCCGHLFCWACFYQVPDVDSTSKECPVCKGEVSNGTIIPIYGNGDSESVCETESGLKIPPRPKARRVESVRQQTVTHGLSHVPVAEALRRIRISIGAMGHQTQQQEGRSDIPTFDTEPPQEGQNAEAAGSRNIRIHQVSRALSENVASLSSLSSALVNTERLIEDLETAINYQFSRNDARLSLVNVGTAFTGHFAVLQSDNQPPDPDSGEDLNSALPITVSSQSTDIPGSSVHILRMRTSTEISMPMVPSYSLRRRSIMPRNPDTDSSHTHESRRRRLN
ncbi:E3 ubiquitin-protein ligase RMA1 [Sesamum alatum]|uniref:E3 ubiquitin-protein ligase RMA n=1 Tax=Sesamum alatum TaxID=300844 RepID=A0AAE2C9Y2_9LAMI|nr:E3 ubiquitin-protein ligase RMA1 [Sesamum alatum]